MSARKSALLSSVSPITFPLDMNEWRDACDEVLGANPFRKAVIVQGPGAKQYKLRNVRRPKMVGYQP